VGAPAQKPARDDPGVVDERGEGREEELLPRVLDGHQQPADVEEDLRGEDDPGEARGRGGLRRGEARQDERDDLPGEQFPQHDEKDHGDSHHRGDRRERPQPLLFLPLREEAGEHRDERDGQRAARQEVVQEIGDGERGEVGVRLRGRAVLVRDDGVPRVPEDAGQEHRRHHHRRRAPHLLVVGVGHCGNYIVKPQNRTAKPGRR